MISTLGCLQRRRIIQLEQQVALRLSLRLPFQILWTFYTGNTLQTTGNCRLPSWRTVAWLHVVRHVLGAIQLHGSINGFWLKLDGTLAVSTCCPPENGRTVGCLNKFKLNPAVRLTIGVILTFIWLFSFVQPRKLSEVHAGRPTSGFISIDISFSS